MNSVSNREHQQLATHQTRLDRTNNLLQQLFSTDEDRTRQFSLNCGGLYADFSKNLLDTDAVTQLLQLATACGLPQARAALFAGEHVNNTEQRPALHMALRGHIPARRPEIADTVSATLDEMETFVNAVIAGEWRGHTGQVITDVVNIGIGGSDLGPAMATAALRQQHNQRLRCHFVSNVDPAHMRSCLACLNPEQTLFIVASKSFTTLETLQNAQLARRWFLDSGGQDGDIAKHFIAVSVNTSAAVAFGIAPGNIFPMWDWVGGRYSLWSAIGLPIALATSMATFRQLLAGAALMDEHFMNAPLAQNIPVLQGLLTVWYRNFWQADSQAILPYAQDLHMLPGFLQQLEMESLGKSVDKSGKRLTQNSGPVIWGSAGTNGQHSFHQLLHQGTQMIPADFIAVARAGASADEADKTQHLHLLANCFAQSRALMFGKSLKQSLTELQDSGISAVDANTLAPHKVITGNRPSTTFVLDELNAYNLGTLIAMYEHKVFVQSVIWNINAFDQWGVELGKQLSGPMFMALSGDQQAAQSLDKSSQMLLAHCARQQQSDRKNS